MKARIKATGEIVDLECCELLDDEERKPRTRQEYNNANSTQAACNWVEVRNQAAIAAMQGTITILSNSDRGAFTDVVVEGFKGNEKTYPNEIAEFAIACADALIKQLKGE